MGSRKDFVSSNTFKNLQAAYEAEIKASMKYHIYGKKAKEDGYMQIGTIFDETSMNEREHAEIWLKLMKGGKLPTTLDNLKDSYSSENYEWTNMYIEFAQEARKEGYEEIAELFEGVASVERHHDSRFRKLASNIMSDSVYNKKTNVLWICISCGNLFYGVSAPEPCPVCGCSQEYYELNKDNY